MSSPEAGGGAEAMKVGSRLAEAEACGGASGRGCATFCFLEARARGMVIAMSQMNRNTLERGTKQDKEWTRWTVQDRMIDRMR